MDTQHRCDWDPGSLSHYRVLEGLLFLTPYPLNPLPQQPIPLSARRLPRIWDGRGPWLCPFLLSHPIDLQAPSLPSLDPDRLSHQARTWCQALKNRRLTQGFCPQGAYGFGKGEKGRGTQNQPWFPIVSSPIEFPIKCHGNVEIRGAEEEDNACRPRGRSGICDWGEGILGCRNIKGAWRVPWFIREVP